MYGVILNIIKNVFKLIGEKTIKVFSDAGNIALMLADAIRMISKRPFRFKLLLKQIEFIGNNSVPIVILTGIFTGMVFGLQCYVGFRTFGAESMAGTIVALAMIRELGPVLSSIMVAARAGSAMTAELGTMKVTEQVDALSSMAVDPVHYLMVPRLIASMIVMPLMNAICILFGLLGGYFVNVIIMGTNSVMYYDNSIQFVSDTDIFHSMFKAFIFGTIIASVCCYNGFNTNMGAEGVGKATTTAVVQSCVLILMFDYVITSFLV